MTEATIIRRVKVGLEHRVTKYCPICGWESDPVTTLAEARRKAAHACQGAAGGAFRLTEPRGRMTCR